MKSEAELRARLIKVEEELEELSRRVGKLEEEEIRLINGLSRFGDGFELGEKVSAEELNEEFGVEGGDD